MPIRRVFKVEGSQSQASTQQQVEVQIKPAPPTPEIKSETSEVEEEPTVDSGLHSRTSGTPIESIKSPETVQVVPETGKVVFSLSVPRKMDQLDETMSFITEDDDTMSMIGPSDTDGRIKQRSIAYENPDLAKMIRSTSKPGFKPIAEGPLSSLTEVSNEEGRRPTAAPLLIDGEKDDTNQTGRQEALAEANENVAATGSAATAAVDTIYETFRNSENNKVSIHKFLNTLTANGIRTTDPRLDESMHRLKKIMKRYGADFGAADTLLLAEKEFKDAIRPNAMTISRFLRTNFVVPEWNEFCRHVFRLYAMCKSNNNGKPSDFIPQLEAYDRNLWGVAICSVDGQRFSTGDYNVPFCLQAVSRVLNYAIVLNDLGGEKLHDFVGQEPSGRDAKELVLDENNKPHNPMISSGAIVVTSLLKAEEKHMADRFDAVHSLYKKMAGNNEFIGFLNQAYLSERQVAYRSYAMGYFLRENKCLPEPERLTETMELMFQLGAVEVSCESLAVMAATLANGGVCPITGEYVIDSNCVRDVLSLMYTTGMGDYSGQFAFKVGLPAKSSISGAIMLVIPNVMGIAVWSPPLDNRRNSARGIQFCTELVKTFNFHNYDNLRFTQKKLDPRKMQVENKAHQVVLTLFSAANGDLTALSRFYLQGVDLTVADYDRRTPLHIAAAEGHLNCVQFLVEKARVPSRPVDRWNNTPADDARYHNHPEIANYLENWDLKPKASQPALNGSAVVTKPLDTKPPVSVPTSGYDGSLSDDDDDFEAAMPGSAFVQYSR